MEEKSLADITKLKQLPPNVSGDDQANKEYTELLDHAKLNRFYSDTWDRKWLAVWSAVVSTLWLASVVAILIKNHCILHLSDAVIITLLGTTTLNVLGIIYIVLRGHFQSKNE